MADDNTIIGIVGLTNMVLLALVVLWRMTSFVLQSSTEDRGLYPFKKKLFFYMLLLLTPIADVPMYCAFIIYGKFTIIAYSFHCLESALLFAAFSLTISDWSVVLYQIQEYKLYSFLFQRASLISINILYSLISLINFIFCYQSGDFAALLNSSVYLLSYLFQILASFLLVSLMLSFGLKLSFRIRGAAGAGMNNSVHDSRYSNNSYNPYNSINNKNGNGESVIYDVPSTAGINDADRGSDPSTQKIVTYGPISRTLNATSAKHNAVATDGSNDRDSGTVSARESSMSIPFPKFDDKLISGESTPIRSEEDQEIVSTASIPYRISESMNIPPQSNSLNVRHSHSNEFRSALWNLNAVMATCTLCIFMQIILLSLNYILGYADDSTAYVGPEFFYWTCYFWLPMWGPVLALLYLCRAHSSREAKEKSIINSHHSSTTSGARSAEVRSNSSSFGRFLYNPLYSASINGNAYEILTNSNLSTQLLEEQLEGIGRSPGRKQVWSPVSGFRSKPELLGEGEDSKLIVERNGSITSDISSYSIESSDVSSHSPFSRMQASQGSRDTLF